MLNLLRLLLYPFSVVFGLIVRLRGVWYASRSWKSPVPTIVVGNLSTGGTGKTPHAAMVADILLQHGKHPATLSRGYGRKSKGFFEVLTESVSWEVGDEPLMIKNRFPELPVFVCESRIEGIQRLLRIRPMVEFVVLDDAYQHRALKPDVAIVLLTYASLEKTWLLLPAGDGREPLSALSRSQAVIITKCPSGITSENKDRLRKRIKKYTDSPVFFSEYKYLGFINPKGENIKPNSGRDKALLLAGIADPQSLVYWLKPQFFQLDSILFSDHYHFSMKELKDVLFQASDGYIIITEKDKVRIHDVWPEFLQNPNVLVVPITPDLGKDSRNFEKFLFDRLNK
jgi:tetraacyldisaccharide 4'-kinase